MVVNWRQSECASTKQFRGFCLGFYDSIHLHLCRFVLHCMVMKMLSSWYISTCFFLSHHFVEVWQLLNSLQNGGTSWVSFNSFSLLNPLQDFNTSSISWSCTYKHPACMTGGWNPSLWSHRVAVQPDIRMISFLSSHHSIYRLWRLEERLQHAYTDSPTSWLGFLGVIKIGLIFVSFSLSLHCGWLGAGVSLGLDVEVPAWSSRSLSQILATDHLAVTTQRACFTALILSALPSSTPFAYIITDLLIISHLESGKVCLFQTTARERNC